jgi:hypothetical protein
MLATGAELIKTSASQAERLDKFKPVEGPAPIAKSQPGTSHLDSGTQDALMRFARFIHKEKKKKPFLEVVKPARRKPSIQPYLKMLSMDEDQTKLGSNLDIYR